MNLNEYYAKIGTIFTDEEKGEKLINFIYMQIKTLGERIDIMVNVGIAEKFFKKICVVEQKCYFSTIAKIFLNEENIIECIKYYSVFLTILKNNKNEFYEYCLNELKESIFDNHFNISIVEDQEGCYIFPSGNKDMDEPLIFEPLECLSKYPEIRELAINSMKKYYSMNGEDISEIVDGFRKLLEQFMQKYFGVDSSLANMKSLYGNKLSESGVNTEVASEFEKILNLYDMYNNNHAKHHKDAKRNDVEYIMYETFNIIRLLLQIK